MTATVLDERCGMLGTETIRVSGDGHRAIEAWALSFGPIARWASRAPAAWTATPNNLALDQAA